MDSMKLRIFVMVILCGTTLASANAANKELEAKPLNETKDDDHSSSTKRAMGAGDIIAAGQLTLEVLTKILDALGSVERKIAIGVDNNSGEDWEALNVYFYSGTSDVALPRKVPSGQALLYNARKVAGPKARGCVGIMSYYIPGLDKTLSVMFSDPYDFSLYKSWWAVALSTGRSPAENGRYKKMYHGTPKPFRADDAWHKKSIGAGLEAEGTMSSSGTPTLEIHVKKEA